MPESYCTGQALWPSTAVTLLQNSSLISRAGADFLEFREVHISARGHALDIAHECSPKAQLISKASSARTLVLHPC